MTSAATVDEAAFTPHGERGWAAWNAWSPEVEFCRFVGMLQRMVAPTVAVETGVGAGRITEQLDTAACQWLGFESDASWRSADAQSESTPDAQQMAAADLVILDSDRRHRFDEIERWAAHGKPGSVCVIHDAGNGHGKATNHYRIRQAILATGIPGVFLANPRGGWVGIHP